MKRFTNKLSKKSEGETEMPGAKEEAKPNKLAVLAFQRAQRLENNSINRKVLLRKTTHHDATASSDLFKSFVFEDEDLQSLQFGNDSSSTIQFEK
mmetsp:Transcript_5446/g.8345  ORF Transcript_5446/g.8345 Transcript_5446/m.8345 type:complete len:95 (-) Transcript_5446:251-535(-)